MVDNTSMITVPIHGLWTTHHGMPILMVALSTRILVMRAKAMRITFGPALVKVNPIRTTIDMVVIGLLVKTHMLSTISD